MGKTVGGVKISGEAVLCNGRGVTREKSQFQTGYIPRRRKLRFARFDASVKSSPAPLLLLSPQSLRLCGGPQLITGIEVMCMAKDGTNRGGARIGAGQKKKPLADKILEGNPGRRKLMVMEFTDAAELEGESMPPPRDYLAAKQKNGKTTLAVEIYEKTWQWLKERRCVHLIPAQLIEQYAQSVARWIQCEECITEFGFLAKHPTTGNAIPSPYVAMSQSFMKQANNLWYQIYQVVRENCATEYKGATPHDDVMEKLLTARRGG
jgi:hypothetical protein